MIVMTDDERNEFVSSMYRTFLLREPDEEGLAAHTQALSTGTVTIAQLVNVFANSNEYNQRRLKMAIADLYTKQGSEKLKSAFPEDFVTPGEAGRSYLSRLRSGFLDKYCSGDVILDVGYSGYDNPNGVAGLPNAIGVDLDYPGYDGMKLPFEDGSVDTVFSSHCLEHILFDHAAIRDWHRVLKIGGFIVCMVPSQALYEKKRFLPSNFNADHKRMYTPSSLAASFESALEVNSYRIRHLAENDSGYDYNIGPEKHSNGPYEIEIVVEKIMPPRWKLA